RAAAGSEWESGQRVPVDSDGWPRRAPFQVNGGEHYPHTLMPLYAPGVYTVRFRGAGRIELIAPNGGGRQVIASAGGTTEKKLRFNPTLTDNVLYLELRASSAAEPVRDIEVVAPGQDTELQSKPFHPTFVASLAPYKTLRFMDWMKTNLTALERWDQRTKRASYTQTRHNGVAHEYVIALANQTRKSPWICIPHAADDDYVRRTARLYRDTLDPKLKLYVEYSNETWNGAFVAADYVQVRGQALGLDADRWMAGQKFVAKRSAEIFRTFAQEFGTAQRGRLVNVLATQAANLGVTTQRLDAMDDPRINPARVKPDAIAIAPYFGVNYEPGDPVPTAAQVATTLSQATIRESLAWTRAQRAVARARGLRLVCYEGGQHFVGILGAENNGSLTSALHAGNRDPRMQDRYREYFAGLEREGVDLFVNFTHVGGWTQWGSWGVLEHQRQSPSRAPKWRALVQWHRMITSPTARITSPSRLVGATYRLKAKVADDVRPVRVRYRLKGPTARGYGLWISRNLDSKEKVQTWSDRIKLGRLGLWSIQIQAFDGGGKRSRLQTVEVNRIR
ncbi:MAG: hypothetical protein ACO3Z6_16090, partial [Pseudomonadales bacterium]